MIPYLVAYFVLTETSRTWVLNKPDAPESLLDRRIWVLMFKVVKASHGDHTVPALARVSVKVYLLVYVPPKVYLKVAFWLTKPANQ